VWMERGSAEWSTIFRWLGQDTTATPQAITPCGLGVRCEAGTILLVPEVP
jgi:hypothetical protein